MSESRITRRQFTAMLGGGTLLLTGLAGSRSASAAGLLKITHAEAVETLFYLPLYVAHEAGFFKEQGLDVTIYNAQQRTIALRAVIAGDAFSYDGDPAEPALARKRGVNVKNIGVLVNRAGGTLLGKKGISSDAKAWKGFRIITPRPPHTSVSLVRMLLLDAGYSKADADGMVWKPSAGAPQKDYVHLTPVLAGSELAALEAGQGNLSIVLEPSTSIGISHGYAAVTSFAEHFGPFFYTSIAVMESMIQKHPEHVQAFVNAMTKACKWGHKYPDKAAELGVKRYPKSDPAIVRSASKRIIEIGAYPEDLVVSKQSYDNNFNRLLVRTHHPAAKYPFNELMDVSFAEKAAKEISV